VDFIALNPQKLLSEFTSQIPYDWKQEQA
jgi:hypothetical protein